MTDSFGLEQKICDAESKCLSCGAPLPESRAEQKRFTGGRSSMQVLGGLDEEIMNKASKLMEEATKAVEISGKTISVTMVTDEAEIASYNVRKLPALIINGSIVSQGILSDADEILQEIEFLL